MFFTLRMIKDRRGAEDTVWSTIIRLVSQLFTIFLRAERITGGQM